MPDGPTRGSGFQAASGFTTYAAGSEPPRAESRGPFGTPRPGRGEGAISVPPPPAPSNSPVPARSSQVPEQAGQGQWGGSPTQRPTSFAALETVSQPTSAHALRVPLQGVVHRDGKLGGTEALSASDQGEMSAHRMPGETPSPVPQFSARIADPQPRRAAHFEEPLPEPSIGLDDDEDDSDRYTDDGFDSGTDARISPRGQASTAQESADGGSTLDGDGRRGPPPDETEKMLPQSVGGRWSVTQDNAHQFAYLAACHGMEHPPTVVYQPRDRMEMHEALMDWLTKQGTSGDINVRDPNLPFGRSLVYIAARMGNVPLLRKLLSLKAQLPAASPAQLHSELEDEDQLDDTQFALTEEQRKWALSKMVREELGDIEEDAAWEGRSVGGDPSPLYAAVLHGHWQCAFLLLRRGHFRSGTDHWVGNTSTAVLDAAFRNTDVTCSALMKVLRMTPAPWAHSSGDAVPLPPEMICADACGQPMHVLDASLQHKARDDSAFSPLHGAVLVDDEVASIQEIRKVAEASKKVGAERVADLVNQRDPNGATALHWATFMDRLGCPGEGKRKTKSTTRTEALLQEFPGMADPNLRDCDGWTPLHWAVICGDASLVKLLLTVGADAHQPLTRLMLQECRMLTGVWKSSAAVRDPACVIVGAGETVPRSEGSDRRAVSVDRKFPVRLVRRRDRDHPVPRTVDLEATLVRILSLSEHVLIVQEAGGSPGGDGHDDGLLSPQAGARVSGSRWVALHYDPLSRVVEVWDKADCTASLPGSTTSFQDPRRPSQCVSTGDLERRSSGQHVEKSEVSETYLDLLVRELHLPKQERTPVELLKELGVMGQPLRRQHGVIGYMTDGEILEMVGAADPSWRPWTAWEIFDDEMIRDRQESESRWLDESAPDGDQWTKSSFPFYGQRFQSLLHLACEQGRAEVVKALVGFGRDSETHAGDNAGPSLMRRLDRRGRSPLITLLSTFAARLKPGVTSYDPQWQSCGRTLLYLFNVLTDHPFYGGRRGWQVWSRDIVIPAMTACEVWPTGTGFSGLHFRRLEALSTREPSGVMQRLLKDATFPAAEREVNGILIFLLHDEEAGGRQQYKSIREWVKHELGAWEAQRRAGIGFTGFSVLATGERPPRAAHSPSWYRFEQRELPRASSHQLYARLLHAVHSVCAQNSAQLLDRLKSFICNHLPDVSTPSTCGEEDFEQSLLHEFRDIDQLRDQRSLLPETSLRMYALRLARGLTSDAAVGVATAFDSLAVLRSLIDRWCPSSGGAGGSNAQRVLANDSLGTRLLRRAVNHQSQAIAEWLAVDGDVDAQDDVDEILDVTSYRDAPPSIWEVQFCIKHNLFKDPARTWDELFSYSHHWAGSQGLNLDRRCWAVDSTGSEHEGGGKEVHRMFVKNVPAGPLAKVLQFFNLHVTQFYAQPAIGVVNIDLPEVDSDKNCCLTGKQIFSQGFSRGSESARKHFEDRREERRASQVSAADLGHGAQKTRELMNRGVLLLQFDSVEDLELARKAVERANQEHGTNARVIAQRDVVRILRELFQLDGVDVSSEIDRSDRNRLLNGFDFGEFTDHTRLGRVLLLLIKKLSSQLLLPRRLRDFLAGFTINGITFREPDFAALSFPFHLLCLRGHRRTSSDGDAVRGLAVQFAEFINEFLQPRVASAELRPEEEELRQLAQTIATRTPQDMLLHFHSRQEKEAWLQVSVVVSRSSEAGGAVHVLDANSAHFDQLPIEVAIELHQVDVLRAMLNSGDRVGGACDGGGAWRCGGKVTPGNPNPNSVIVREVEVLGGRGQLTRHAVAAYNDVWVPSSREWTEERDQTAWVPLAADLAPRSVHGENAHRPLLHRALSLLAPRRPKDDDEVVARWENKNRHLMLRAPGGLSSFGAGVSTPPAFAPSSGASWGQAVPDPRTTRAGEHAHEVENQRRKVVELLLGSIIERSLFPQPEAGRSVRLRIGNLVPAPPIVESEKGRRPSSGRGGTMSRFWDRAGLFCTSFYALWVRLRSPYLRPLESQRRSAGRLMWVADGRPLPDGRGPLVAQPPQLVREADITLYSGTRKLEPIRSYYDDESGSIVLRLARPTEISAYRFGGKQWPIPWQCRWTLEGAADDARDADDNPCTCRDAEERRPAPFRLFHSVVKGRMAVGHKLTLDPTVHNDVTEVADGGEFGLSLLCQRAPWWWHHNLHHSLHNVLLAHPCGPDMLALNWRMRLSHAPILVERRHQWGRSYRVTKFKQPEESESEDEDKEADAERPKREDSGADKRRASAVTPAGITPGETGLPLDEPRKSMWERKQSMFPRANSLFPQTAEPPLLLDASEYTSRAAESAHSETEQGDDTPFGAYGRRRSKASFCSVDTCPVAPPRCLIKQDITPPELPEWDSATPVDWIEEPPGERTLILDNGLTLPHWASLYGARCIMNILMDQDGWVDPNTPPEFLRVMEERRSVGALLTSIQFRFISSTRDTEGVTVDDIVIYGEDWESGPRGLAVTGSMQKIINLSRVWERETYDGPEVDIDGPRCDGPEQVVHHSRNVRTSWFGRRQKRNGEIPTLQIDFANPVYVTGYHLFADKKGGAPTHWTVHGAAPPMSVARAVARDNWLELGEEVLQEQGLEKVTREYDTVADEDPEKCFWIEEDQRETASRPRFRLIIPTQYLGFSPLHYGAYSGAVELITAIAERMEEAEANLIDYRCECHEFPGQPFTQAEERLLDKSDFFALVSTVMCICCDFATSTISKVRDVTRKSSRCKQLAAGASAHLLRFLSDAYPVERTDSLRHVVGSPRSRMRGRGMGADGTWLGSALRSNLQYMEGGGGLPSSRQSPITAGDSALLISAQFTHIPCTRELLSRDGDPCLRNCESHDAHDVAVAVEERNRLQWEMKGGAKMATSVDKKNAQGIFEEQFRQLHDHEKVRAKLRRFALLNFFSNSIHLGIFIVVVTTIALIYTDPFTSFYATRAMREKIDGEPQPVGPDRQWQETLEDVGEIADIKDWFATPFVNSILSPVSGETFTSPPFQEGPYGLWRLVGPVRVSQLQVTNQSCALPGSWATYADFLQSQAANRSSGWDAAPPAADPCYPCFGIYDSSDLTPASMTEWHHRNFGFRILPLQLTDSVYPNLVGSFLDIMPPPNSSVTPGNLTLLTQGNWIDPSTRLLTVTFVFYNPNIDLFIVGEVIFEVLAQGGVLPNSRYLLVRLSLYQSALDYVRLVLEILFFFVYLWFCFEEIHELVRLFVFEVAAEWEEMNLQKRGILPKIMAAIAAVSRHIMSNWNMIDITIIVLGGFTMTYHFTAIQIQKDLRSESGLLDPSVQKGFYADFVVLAYVTKTEESYLGIMTGLAWVKFLKAWQLMPWVGPVVGAITGTMAEPKVIVFFIVFIEVLLAILLTTHIAFGVVDEQYRTVKESTLTTLRMVLGDWDFDAVERHGVVGEIVFVVVIVVGQIILLNLVIAVIGEVYNEQITNADNVWSRDLVETYLYTIIAAPNPGSFVQAIGEAVRQLSFCPCASLPEAALKLPARHRLSDTPLPPPSKGCCDRKSKVDVEAEPEMAPWREGNWEMLSRLTKQRFDHEEQQKDKSVYQVGEELSDQIDEVKAQIRKMKTDLSASFRELEKRFEGSLPAKP